MVRVIAWYCSTDTQTACERRESDGSTDTPTGCEHTGSARCCSKAMHVSALPLRAASCRGVNSQLSCVLASDPLCDKSAVLNEVRFKLRNEERLKWRSDVRFNDGTRGLNDGAT